MKAPRSLPVFALASAETSVERTLHDLARVIPGAALANGRVESDDTQILQQSGSKTLEVDRRSGHVYWQDSVALWNPRQLARIPGTNAARAVADGCIRALHRTLATDSTYAEVAFSHATHTMTAAHGGAVQAQAAVGDPAHRSEVTFAQCAPLDLQVFYRTQVLVPFGNDVVPLPVTGGGGKYRVAVGNGGRLAGLSGGWRSIVAVSRHEAIKPQREAEAEFRAQFPDHDVRNIHASLAYYAAPAFERQAELLPVWEVGGEMWVEGQRFDIRPHWIAATLGGSDGSVGPAQVPTAANDSSWFHHRPPRDGDMRKCGAAWLGKRNGALQRNKEGFLDGCRALGFDVSFDLGNASAHESIFNARSSQYADAVELMFYTGHANPDGWVMHPPDSSVLVYETAAGAPLRFGHQALEWLIIAACGPLQSSHFRSRASNAFDRWGKTFDGLHGMLGYGSLSRAYSQEAARFMELVGRGSSMVEAWMRTALEVQPCSSAADIAAGRGIYPVAMYAHRGDHATRYEGFGSPISSTFSADDPARQLQMLWMEI